MQALSLCNGGTFLDRVSAAVSLRCVVPCRVLFAVDPAARNRCGEEEVEKEGGAVGACVRLESVESTGYSLSQLT